MPVNIYEPNPNDALSLTELALYHQLMEYRVANGLAEIPLSASLTTVAGRHAVDTHANIWSVDLALPAGANLHSWSDAAYYEDHRQPETMWEAPQRLGTAYPSAGYEISAAGFDSIEGALEGWQGSPGHDPVIRNTDSWARVTWNAIGIGVIQESGPGIDRVEDYGGRIYHVWFGEEVDPAGAPSIAGTEAGEAFAGTAFGDVLDGRGGDDTITGAGGDDRVEGGAGRDVFVLDVARDAARLSAEAGVVEVSSTEGTDRLTGIEILRFRDGDVETVAIDTPLPTGAVGTAGDDRVSLGAGDDTYQAFSGDDSVEGNGGNDRLIGGAGRDTLDGGDGSDTLNGGADDDVIRGGTSDRDLRDTIYGAGGNDSVDAGHGNDLVYGGDGDDTLAGGFGVDEIQGQDGDDVITGSAFSDLVFGGAGDDFVNGGFGSDRINGGSGADRFYHAGVAGHGSDWVQDYAAAEGDVLLFGGTAAGPEDFRVSFAHTTSAEGERAGDDSVEEAFVVYRPTGQILWALVDGAGEVEIGLQIGGAAAIYDLLGP